MKQTLLLVIAMFMFSGMQAQGQPGTEAAGFKLKQTSGAGREPETEERNITVYPNPTSGTLNLSLTGFGGKKTSVSIMNVIGTVVHQETLFDADPRFTATIDVTKFANGLYYIKLQADDYSVIQKVVLK